MTVRLLCLSILLFLVNDILLSSGTEKKLKIKKLDQAAVIDGVIDAEWSKVDSVSDFFQLKPFFAKEPARKTTAKVMTTTEAIYCIIISYDEKKNIQQNTGKLDDRGGDIVSLMLDTFGDKRTAYKFAISASGVRNDCRLLDDGRNRDYSWDGVWYSAAKVYDWGFVVEMEIPYRSIQYDEKLNEWGLDFDRWIPSINEDLYWCEYEENEGQRISKFGKLVFEDFKPVAKGLNLEIYPVGITKATFLHDSKYKIDPNAGIDIFYNPSKQLTYQLTVNPDFAQIEADPFDFNITRYESYFNERRPFFTEGNEVFMAAGRQEDMGFIQPLELFYSRRIGKKLADGSEVPLIAGTKAFGRINDWEYGGFLAFTGKKDYTNDMNKFTEQNSSFASLRLKRQILENSSIGLLYVGMHNEKLDNGVIDIDGAFRASKWQFSYQLAHSYSNSVRDFAVRTGFALVDDDWIIAVRQRYVGWDFNVDQVGYVPWKGTSQIGVLGGPRWYFKDGPVSGLTIYGGGESNNKKIESYTDRVAILGWNMQFRANWGYEINASIGRAKESGRIFDYSEFSLSFNCMISPKWMYYGNAGYQRTYNFYRDYLAFYSYYMSEFTWHAFNILDLGTVCNLYIEGNPDNDIEDITLNTRPYFSITPINDLSFRVYVDNVYTRSSDKLEHIFIGLLFSYNFTPKSWIYFAVNELHQRINEYDSISNTDLWRMKLTDRIAVFKIKYLYYF